MKRIALFLLTLLLSASSANAQKLYAFVGLHGSGGGTAKVPGASLEIGASIRDTLTGVVTSFSLDVGMLFNKTNAPDFQDYSIPHSGIERTQQFTDDFEYLVAANIGGFFDFGLGMFGTVGFTALSRVLLDKSDATGWWYKNEDRTAIFGVLGGDLRWMWGPGSNARVGYQMRRGFVAGLSFGTAAKM